LLGERNIAAGGRGSPLAVVHCTYTTFTGGIDRDLELRVDVLGEGSGTAPAISVGWAAVRSAVLVGPGLQCRGNGMPPARIELAHAV
jgi:hypothetical protein